MIQKKVDTGSLFILKINELIYVPDTEGAMFGNLVICAPGYYTHDYYTVAKKVKDGVYKDLLSIRKYKDAGSFGYGVLRNIEEKISIQDIDLQNDNLTKKEFLYKLKKYVKKYEDNQIQESVNVLCRK